MKALLSVCVVCVLAAAGVPGPAHSQTVPKAVPAPLPRFTAAVPEPTEPPAQTVRDRFSGVRFELPAGWNMTRRDGELSQFHLDARTAPRRAELRAAAGLAFNPYPLSTFAGALFYLSAAPGQTVPQCEAQTTFSPVKPLPPVNVQGVAFARGEDDHGHICTESRDMVYTTLRGGLCLRFDLIVNTFCGGEVSGAKDMTDAELNATFSRLQNVMATVRFEP